MCVPLQPVIPQDPAVDELGDWRRRHRLVGRHVCFPDQLHPSADDGDAPEEESNADSEVEKFEFRKSRSRNV